MTAEPNRAVLRLAGFDNHGITRARYRGREIEVEHGIPGETVEVEIAGRRRLLGKIVDILDPAADRVIPPCEYFREWSCGGCQWQQMAYAGQLARKREGVERAMWTDGLDLQVDTVHALPDPWRYRSTAGISLGKHAGFRRHASLAIVPIHDCPISHPRIGALMGHLNARLEDGTLPDFRGRLRLDVRLGDVDRPPRLQILIRPSHDVPHGKAGLDALIDVLESFPGTGGVAVAEPDGAVTTVSGDLFAPVSIDGRPVWLAAGAFFQTNLRLLPSLVARVRAEAQPLAGRQVADLYAGVGVFGLFLAGEAREVVAVEPDPLAAEAAGRTAAHWGLNNFRVVVGRAEEAVHAVGRFDTVIVDPPRSGLAEPVHDALGAARPPLVLYISCLAQSLARDLRALTASGYRVERLELFDFYPQTYHVELLAVLRSSA